MRPSDLKVGDKVVHANVGNGIVTNIENDTVYVLYETPQFKTNAKGEYDRRWFELHPDLLTHRT